MIAQYIEPMVRVDPSLKVKNVIAEIQNHYEYLTTYRKAWVVKQKAIKRVYDSWEGLYEELPNWLATVCYFDRHARVEFEALLAYYGTELVPNIQIFKWVFWTFGPCRRAFRHCKPLVQVDRTHLYGQYKETLLIAVAQDGNQNILPITFAIVEGETTDV